MRRELFYLTGTEPRIKTVLRATYPGYFGRTIILSISDSPVAVPKRKAGTDWNIVFYDLNSNEARAMPIPALRRRTYPPIDLPQACIAVEHRFERARDRGITIHVKPRDLDPAMLPPQDAVSPDEETVLRITREHPASYGGNVRFRQTIARRDTGMTAERWQALREALQARQLLKWNGGISARGRNVLAYRDTELLRDLVPRYRRRRTS